MNQKQTNGWKQARLGEFFRIKHGWAFKGEFFADAGPYVLLTPGNFNEEGGLRLKGEKEKYYTGEVPSEFILKHGDLLVVMTEQAEGLLGSPAIIPEGDRYLHNQRLGLLVDMDESVIDKFFLYYLFNLREVRAQIRATANGAKVRHTSPDRIYQVKVQLPPLPLQERIASILSAYDDLIENNTRRIKILEEMARAIYREWFVHFRFPGHEKVKLVDSPLGKIPGGWEVKRLGEVIELAYGEALIEQDRIDGPVPVFGSSGVVGYHNEPFVKGPSIIVGRKGNVGSVFWSDLDFYPIDTVFFVRTELSLPYVFYNLQHQNFISGDAAVPGLSRNAAYLKPFLVPRSQDLEGFEKIVVPVFGQLRVLQEKNDRLRQARDLLLPKLISGDLKVCGEEETVSVA